MVREGYKQTAISLTPEDWEVCPLENIAGLEVGYAFKSTWFDEHRGIPLLRGENVGYGRPDWSDIQRLPVELAKTFSAYKLNSGDIVIGMDRTFTKSGTKISVLSEKDCPCLLVQRVGKFIPLKCSNSFLWALLSSEMFQSSLKLEQKGMDIPHLSRSEILSPYIPFPIVEAEQEAIAQALSDVNALIAALDKLSAKKRNLKTAAMQQLLTGKKRLPGFGEGQGYKESAIGLIPKDWDALRLGDIAPLQRGFDLPTYQLKKGDYPAVYSNGIMNHHSDFMVNGPGVVTGRSGTIGNVHYVSEDYCPHNTALWVTEFRCSNPKYVYYLYKSIKLERFGSGSGVPTLNRNDVHDWVVAIPKIEEQRAIATVLSDMDTEIAALETRLAKTQALKQGMMQELLTGRTRLV